MLPPNCFIRCDGPPVVCGVGWTNDEVVVLVIITMAVVCFAWWIISKRSRRP